MWKGGSPNSKGMAACNKGHGVWNCGGGATDKRATRRHERQGEGDGKWRREHPVDGSRVTERLRESYGGHRLGEGGSQRRPQIGRAMESIDWASYGVQGFSNGNPIFLPSQFCVVCLLWLQSFMFYCSTRYKWHMDATVDTINLISTCALSIWNKVEDGYALASKMMVAAIASTSEHEDYSHLRCFPIPRPLPSPHRRLGNKTPKLISDVVQDK